MFCFKLFCDTDIQEMHKLLIRETFDDYKCLRKKWNTKYSHLIGVINIEQYNNFDQQTKKDWIEYQGRLSNLKDITINNLLSYCINYPKEKISKHRFVLEYEEHPYHLEQNIDLVLLDL